MGEHANTDSGEDRPEGTPLEVYEWGGGIIAGLGFFMTPLLTGAPALYCAAKIQKEKPLAAIGIGLVLLATVIFWAGFVFGEQVMDVLFTEASTAVLALLAFFLAILIIPVGIFLALILYRQ